MSLPSITIEQDKHDGWHCTIHDGPGYHGVGDTKAKALVRASMAWYTWEAQTKPKEIEEDG